MVFVPHAELEKRHESLKRRLAERELDGALLHGITNVLYFAGTAQQAHLWVPAVGEPVLLVRRVLERARLESACARIEPVASLRQLGAALGSSCRIGMELDILPVASLGRYHRAVPGLEAFDIGEDTRVIRSRKSPLEVAAIRSAAEAADRTFTEIKAALREGMSELDLSIVAEGAERRNGFQGILRWRAASGFECPWVHVLAGESALAFSFADTPYGGQGLTPAAPLGASHRPIRRGEPVNVDFALARNGYIHDMTRTLSIGPLPEELTRGYDACLEVHATARRLVRAGDTGEEVWSRALEVARAHGLEDRFMGVGDQRAGFVGHGVGLELDELPVLAPRQQSRLEVGNVIALEPKFFFPGKGAVGLENTYLVTEDGLENLTLTSEDLAVVD